MALDWGINQTLSQTITAPDFDIAGATFRFDLGKDFRELQLLTVLDEAITRSVADGKLTFSLNIDGAVLATQLEQEKTHTLKWQLVITPSGATVDWVAKGSVKVTPAYSDVVPPNAQPSFYLTTESGLSDLSNVDVSAATNGQALTLVGDTWVGGDAGGGGGVAFAITAPAATALSALRVVVEEGGEFVYADPSSASHAQQAAGLVTQAYAQAETATARLSVILSDNGWNWNPALPIWLGANGTLTQTIPTSGFLRVMARAIDATTIYFQAQEAIKL